MSAPVELAPIGDPRTLLEAEPERRHQLILRAFQRAVIDERFAEKAIDEISVLGNSISTLVHAIERGDKLAAYRVVLDLVKVPIKQNPLKVTATFDEIKVAYALLLGDGELFHWQGYSALIRELKERNPFMESTSDATFRRALEKIGAPTKSLYIDEILQKD